MQVSRRGLLIGALAGGGLAVGYLLRDREFPLPLSPAPDEAAFGAWIRISSGGIVTVNVPQLEMGQGVTTLIPQVIAQELGADWRRIAVEPAPLSPHFANALLASRWADLWMPGFAGAASSPGSAIARRWAQDSLFMVTAEGTSLAACEAPCRVAAASARALLCMAAADRWDVDWEDCEAVGGHVTHGARRLSFGELAAAAAGFDPPRSPPLRANPAQERSAQFPPGTPPHHPRLDLPSKADGTYRFAGDVRLPGMVFAAIRHGPIGDSVLSSHESKAADATPGLIAVVPHERWLAAVATDWWSAERALTAMAPRFTARARPDTSRMEAALDEAIRKGDAVRSHESGDIAGGFAARASLAMRYDIAPTLHATLETASAAARLTDGQLELWIASQAPGAARRAVADALGLKLSDVVLYPMPAGGSFDRRLEHEHAVEAAIIAREVGRPVSLTWSRWQEHLAGLPHPPAAALMSARLSGAGELVGWRARIASPPARQELGKRLLGGMSAFEAMTSSEGDIDGSPDDAAIPPYGIPAVAIDHVPVTVGLPVGRMRGNAHFHTAFFTESFLDELAHKAAREPLSFRMAMLGHDLRLAQCLQRCASLANWDAGADASGQGLACHLIPDSWGGTSGGRIAVIATARRDERGVRVDRIAAVADIGRIVNLDIARQQIEGGLVFGMGLALGSSTGYAEGLPVTGRLAALSLPLLADCPQIDVDFIDSDAEPFDPGELGVVAAPPAIANALFSATGTRFRRLPLLSDEI